MPSRRPISAISGVLSVPLPCDGSKDEQVERTHCTRPGDVRKPALHVIGAHFFFFFFLDFFLRSFLAFLSFFFFFSFLSFFAFFFFFASSGCDSACSGGSSDPPGAGKRQFGYSRDKRFDCVQVVIALIVTPDGFLIAYEVLAGNTADNTTLADFLDRIEAQYGKAERIWVIAEGHGTVVLQNTVN